MPKFIQQYVRIVDKVNRVIGRAAMYMIFVMAGVLIYSSVSKAFFVPALWTFEVAQFLMVAYFLLGGAYSIQLDSHVRMDLIYGSWSERSKLWIDVFTIFFLIAYLILLLTGAILSTEYAISYGERSYSAWRPYMWPIKMIMTFGIVMMLLQVIAQFFKDLAKARGKPLS
ncbi:MAG: TRAP transporter small permease subunit [Gammaproteobacteria bacterium]|nr:TRAP transporter small permease subunit [Gammaproteobacteria bacterium]